MLYFLVAFIALTVIKQWNPSFSPQAANYQVCHSDDSRPSTYPLHGYHNTYVHDSFPNINLPLDHNLMGSIWPPSYIASGCKTHNTSYASFIECRCHLIPGCTASHPTCISSKWHRNVTTSCGMTYKLSYQSCRRQVMPASCKLSRSATISFYVLPCKRQSNSPFSQTRPNSEHYESPVGIVTGYRTRAG
jgi:hypothetical protein